MTTNRVIEATSKSAIAVAEFVAERSVNDVVLSTSGEIKNPPRAIAGTIRNGRFRPSLSVVIIPNTGGLKRKDAIFPVNDLVTSISAHIGPESVEGRFSVVPNSKERFSSAIIL